VTVGAWTFYSVDQGLTPSIQDVSADEGGNVYVAGYDALFVKARGEAAFRRVDPVAAGLTPTCRGTTDAEREAFRSLAAPPVPPSVCPVISVAGTSAGKAVVGYKGVGTDQDRDGNWALWSGGADVVAFDGASLSRVRHVLVASPPGVVCETWLDPPTNSQCWVTGDFTWVRGRHKMRQIQRIAVNRRAGIGRGDVLMGGTHGTFALLVANPAQRGWSAFDQAPAGAAKDPRWADAQYVWEHEHADDTTAPSGVFRSGTTWALAFDPATGVAWGANEFRLASMPGYASMRRPAANNWWGSVERTTIWRPEADPSSAALRDNVQSIAFCDDGTMWIASMGHGLARRRPDGTTSFFSVPGGNGLAAVACDPSDGSIWAGSAFDGGIWRLKDGAWSTLPPEAPAFARTAPVRSIQIDRWASPRIVYFAHQAAPAPGPGGVTAYAGP
jgi:hypothetical protein